MNKMNVNNESELKIMITKEEYEDLFSKSNKIYSQVNHYYRINSDLCVRLRKVNNDCMIQYKVKRPAAHLKALKDNYEYTLKVNKADYLIIQHNPDTLYEYMGMDKKACDHAEFKGTLETIRGHIKIDDKMPELQIDLNRYNGNVDYELEWEINRKQYDKAVKILKDMGINIDDRVVGVSKFKRLQQSDICQ